MKIYILCKQFFDWEIRFVVDVIGYESLHVNYQNKQKCNDVEMSIVIVIVEKIFVEKLQLKNCSINKIQIKFTYEKMKLFIKKCDKNDFFFI